MVPCYLYILYYGLAGHRVGQGTRLNPPFARPRPYARMRDAPPAVGAVGAMARPAPTSRCMRFSGAQRHHQGCCRTGRRLAEDRVARDQQRAVGACAHARESAARDRRARLPARPFRAQPAQHPRVCAGTGLRQPQRALHHQPAARRAVGVPQQRLRPADPSLRFVLAEARRRIARSWCGARAWPGWCWRRRCPSSRS